MKIDLYWIQKELDAGRKVELEGCGACYIDKDNYVLSIDSDGLVVSIGTGKMRLSPDSLKHFRIKRPTPTFDDLIDVAVQAKKDGIISDIHWGNDQSLSVFCADGLVVSANEEVSGAFIRVAINDINSLYTETFVIESEEDLKRIKLGSKITLLNEQVITVRAVGNYGVYFEEDKSIAGELILKGATVTQKRS